METSVIITLLIPFIGTLIGSSFVFFMKREMPPLFQKALLGFASGVMVAAAVWSLLIPSMEMSSGEDIKSVIPAAAGFILGVCFLLAIDYLTPHLHIGDDRPEGLKARLSRTAMLALAVTIHNIPEGMAVGVVIAGALSDGISIAPAAAMATAIGIAIQNIPEGAIISMPMRSAGNSRRKSFLIGALSGVVEPIGAVIVILLASLMTPVLPYFLAFAAGAMMYVVVEELIPEASEGQHSNIGTVGFAVGFVLMMVLDVAQG
jgi:zinc transporter, ZIP family